jgi:hypothetical protein
VNTNLLLVNPVLASGFTIFSLIYSVVAEFFGTKAPTIEELKAKESYLKETASVVESIKQLEEKSRAKGILEHAKDAIKGGKEVWKEIKKQEETAEESDQQAEQSTDGSGAETDKESLQESGKHFAESTEESEQKHERKAKGNEEESMLVWTLENMPAWLTTGGSTISLQAVVRETKLSMKRLRNRVESKEIRATKNKDIVYKDSLIQWMKAQGIIEESPKIVHLNERRNAEETTPNDERQATDTETVEA